MASWLSQPMAAAYPCSVSGRREPVLLPFPLTQGGRRLPTIASASGRGASRAAPGPPLTPFRNTLSQVPQFQDWVRIVRRDDCDNASHGNAVRVMGAGRPGWVPGKSARVKAAAGESTLPPDCTAAFEEALTCEERCVRVTLINHTCQHHAEVPLATTPPPLPRAGHPPWIGSPP